MSRFCWRMDSPVGWLTLCEENGCLTNLIFGQIEMGEIPTCCTSVMERAQAQLNAYFAGQLRHFDLPLAPRGTDFQQQCWQALMEIPYGQLLVLPGIALAGVFIYLLNRQFSFEKCGLDGETIRKLSLALAVFTAPYTMLWPIEWMYF